VVAVAAAGLLIGSSAGAAQRATTNHTLTLVGTDFHTLDYRATLQYVAATGGGVYEQDLTNDAANPNYFEANLDIPAGARVTKVDFLVRDCGQIGGGQSFLDTYLGSLRPGTTSFTYHLHLARVPNNQCGVTTTTARTLAQPLLISAVRRYVVGFRDRLSMGPGGAPDDDPNTVMVGVRVHYACSAGC
jgi:hypothetical protein